MNITHAYDDIIDLPHHVSSTRPQMSLHDRAAQFAPFAALTGHDDVLRQTREANERYYENLTKGDKYDEETGID